MITQTEIKQVFNGGYKVRIIFDNGKIFVKLVASMIDAIKTVEAATIVVRAAA